MAPRYNHPSNLRFQHPCSREFPMPAESIRLSCTSLVDVSPVIHMFRLAADEDNHQLRTVTLTTASWNAPFSTTALPHDSPLIPVFLASVRVRVLTRLPYDSLRPPPLSTTTRHRLPVRY